LQPRNKGLPRQPAGTPASTRLLAQLMAAQVRCRPGGIATLMQVRCPFGAAALPWPSERHSPMLMVACREMTSGDRGVSLAGSRVLRSCSKRQCGELSTDRGQAASMQTHTPKP
jgi:hypothetical protein